MSLTLNRYINLMRQSCSEIKFDAFPQVDASTLLTKVITLDQIYLPLSLVESDNKASISDIDEIIKKIDERIAELEAQEKAGTNNPSTNPLSSTEVIQNEQLANPNQSVTAQNGIRLLITANPGSGKTTFCKKLALALLDHETDFAEKYLYENGLSFNVHSLPVLVNCRNISEIQQKDIEQNSFSELLYKLVALRLGSQFSDVSYEDFWKMILSDNCHSVTLILDGWDEVLDQKKAEAFSVALCSFLDEYSNYDIVITCRQENEETEINYLFTNRFSIKPFSDEDIRSFCENWQEIIWGSNPLFTSNNASLVDQIIESEEINVKKMRSNPLELSFLLTVAGNDGRLPDNKADLFSKLIDLYINWSAPKSSLRLSSKTMRIILAYTASYYTKHKLLYCDYSELERIIKQCIDDLDWVFAEDLSKIDISMLVKKLSQTGVLTIDTRHKYSFSDSGYSTHRQMQEYLTAYAILEQYSDKEDNSKTPREILEGKYANSQWREIIIFIGLMNDGRARRDIIRDLISRISGDIDIDCDYTDLLFELVADGADISPEDRHNIYNVCFTSHITSRQVSLIYDLLSAESKIKSDFKNYIEEHFRISVENNNIQYGYAKGLIELFNAHFEKISPFDYAEALMLKKNKSDIIASMQVFTMLSWFKQVNIGRKYVNGFHLYKISQQCITALRELLKQAELKALVLKTIKELLMAGYAAFTDFFDSDDVKEICKRIEESKHQSDCEIILSVFPPFDASIRPSKADKSIRIAYDSLFREQLEKEQKDDLIFTFCICVAIGCWENDFIEEYWQAIDHIYSKFMRDHDPATAFYFLTNKMYLDMKYDSIKRQYQDVEPELFSSIDRFINSWVLSEKTNRKSVYVLRNKKLVIHYPVEGLSQDAQGFLKDYLNETTATKNNMAYLLRRGELAAIEIEDGDCKQQLTPEMLLVEGVGSFEEFSVINQALFVAGAFVDCIGCVPKGQQYLSTIRGMITTPEKNWDHVIAWWLMLADERQELEGILVLLWLFELGLYNPTTTTHQSLINLLACINKVPDSYSSNFMVFRKLIEDTVKQ